MAVTEPRADAQLCGTTDALTAEITALGGHDTAINTATVTHPTPPRSIEQPYFDLHSVRLD